MQPVNQNEEPSSVSQALADHVSKLILKKFSDLTDGFTSPYARRKVLSGIVMTTSENLDDASVICVTTGTKCINGEYISDQGMALNDCHAEIIGRRCLRLFMLQQLQLLLDPVTSDNSIFEVQPGKIQLRTNIQFHLYISTSPCGDARIFSPHEVSTDIDNGGSDKHPNRKARGQLRTKIESGEGTIPIRNGASGVQTWDGVLQGERLLTMSCSDKIARWNMLGLQGKINTNLTMGK
jgi:double stranded RNA-specific editase B